MCATTAAPTVFQETLDGYLTQIGNLDLAACADILGVTHQEDVLFIPVLDKTYRASGQGITDEAGRQPPFDLSVILAKHLLLCPGAVPASGGWVSYRDFKDTGPLHTYFAQDVENALVKRFSGDLDGLRRTGEALGSQAPEMDLNYDYTGAFAFLPRLPLLVLFNDADEEFGAQGSVLFRADAARYLDGECLAMAANHLIGRLSRGA
jgi:hypothetical protein